MDAEFKYFDGPRYIDWPYSKPKGELAARVEAVKELMVAGLGQASYCRVNPELPPAWRSEWADLSLDAAQSCGLAGLMRQTLPHLTALKYLEAREVADACVFKHAPAQLLELQAMGVDDQS